MRGNKERTASAIANLLRMANADLEDARLLLWRGHRRNAAILAGQALAHAADAINASEQGWPVGTSGLGAVPTENPLHSALEEVEARLRDEDAPTVRADGTVDPNPDLQPVQDAVNRLETILRDAARALAVDLHGSDPAGQLGPIRPKLPDTTGSRQKAAERGRTFGATTLPADAAPAPPPARFTVPTGAPRLRRGRPIIISAPSPGARKPAPPERPEPRRGPARRQRPAGAEPAQEAGTRAASAKANARQDASTQAGPVEAGGTRLRREKPAPSGIGAAQSQASGGQAGLRRAAGSSHGARDVASTVFWSLIDKWGLTDEEALQVIGHSGGLTKKGTRPRFRLTGQEAEIYAFLHEIDAGLNVMGINPSRWLTTSLSEPPYEGTTPLAHIAANGPDGARDVMHTVTMRGLRRAI